MTHPVSRPEADDPQQLRAALLARRVTLDALLHQRAAVTQEARDCVGPLQDWALRQSEYRLAAELRYLDDLLGAVFPS